MEEEPIKKSMEHIVDDAMRPILGISIGELNKDISAKLERSPLLLFDIDTKVRFKKAKKQFKQQFLRRLLRVSYGNISVVAKKAGVDRRSIHRIVKSAGIDVARMRDEMIKPYQIRQKAVGSVIEDVLEHYKQIIHPSRMAEVYKQVDTVSKDILDGLPDKRVTLKKAEEEFEREYLQKALADNGGSLTKTSKKIGLRYETLLRKVKGLKLR
ncbi:MAG: helix-turn-helix domain-containing protein [Candidatus Woesearchaeota archaeon]